MDTPILTEIIDCFTSLEQLITFAETYGLQNEPYVQQRIASLSPDTRFRCTCMAFFDSQEERDKHELMHEYINEFDLDLFDDSDHFSHGRHQQNNQNSTPAYPIANGNDEPPNKKARKTNGEETLDHVGEGDVSEKMHSLVMRRERTYAKNGATDITYDIKMSEKLATKKMTEVTEVLENVFEDVLAQVRQDGNENSLARIVIEHSSLTDPIIVRLQPLEKMETSTIMDAISKTLQSHEEIRMDDDSLSFTIGRINLPSGSGKCRLTNLTGVNNSLIRKRSIVSIGMEDNMCLYRSIAIAFVKTCRCVSISEWKQCTGSDQTDMVTKVLKYRSYPLWYYKHMIDKRRKECTAFANRLCTLVGLDSSRAGNIQDIKHFEKLLNLQILVISAKMGNRFIRIGESITGRKRAYLYLVDTEESPHFCTIVNICGFFSAGYFCETCLKPFNNKYAHSCDDNCTVCCTSDCKFSDTMMSCRRCFRTCRSIECFERHKEINRGKRSQTSECEKRYQCKTCKKVIQCRERLLEDHRCGEWKCPCCQQYHVGEHLCYHRATTPSNTPKTMIFFDSECTQDAILQCEHGYIPKSDRCDKCGLNGERCKLCKLCENCSKSWCGSREHRVNFICMQTACDVCKNKQLSVDPKCKSCGIRCAVCCKMENGKFKRDPCDTCGFPRTIIPR